MANFSMKPLTTTLTVVVFGLGAVGCGSGAGTNTNRMNRPHGGIARSAGTMTEGYLQNDGDNDRDDRTPHVHAADANDAQNLLARYGKEADIDQKRVITSVVRSYFAAAEEINGRNACLLLYRSLASGLSEDAGRPGKPKSGGCETAVNRLFEYDHRQLVEDQVPKMVVIGAHIRGDFALAVLGFRRTPESEILLQRENGRWRIASVFDSQMP